MTIVNKNLKFLRARQGMTQKQFAEKIGVKQSAVGAYEEERATPPLACLIEIAETFKISLDILTRQDLSTVPEKDWQAIQFIRGKDVLAITVDHTDKENIELVTQKASAGYLNGYHDPEFIKELPKISFPVLARNATYRAFEIRGDSMLPIQSGAIIFGQYVENLTEIKGGKPYIIMTKDEGIVFKRVFNALESQQQLLLVSDNRAYPPYAVHVNDVFEVWAAKGFFSTKFVELESKDLSVPADQLAMTILSLQEEIKSLKQK